MRTPAQRLLKMATLTLVVALPLLGMSGLASARTTTAAKAAPKVCAKHPHRAKCAPAGGGATGTGTGGSPVQITVTVDPNPLVETGQSEVHAVIQVETEPAFAG